VLYLRRENSLDINRSVYAKFFVPFCKNMFATLRCKHTIGYSDCDLPGCNTVQSL
jgi:hypothetical protein